MKKRILVTPGGLQSIQGLVLMSLWKGKKLAGVQWFVEVGKKLVRMPKWTEQQLVLIIMMAMVNFGQAMSLQTATASSFVLGKKD